MKITPAWFTAARRRWLYDIGQAGSLIAVGYGLMSSTHALLWLGLAAVLLRVARENV